jgi:hypothetical protein
MSLIAILFYPLFLACLRRWSVVMYPNSWHFAGDFCGVQSLVSNQNFFLFPSGFRNCCGRGSGKFCLF